MKCQDLLFLGHSAVALHYITAEGLTAGGEEKTVAIDPWLKGNPACPEHLKTLPAVDLIILTHGHDDHASEAAALAQESGAHLLATFELASHLQRDGVSPEKIIFMNKGGTVQWEGLEITLTDAKHSNSYTRDGEALYAGEACGVVLRDGSTSIYHAGDTSFFSDMKCIGDRYAPDIALLPIGDVFTMGPEEAAQAAATLGCAKAIPIHYGTFDLLSGSAEDFQKACASQETEVIPLQPGERHLVST
ncbi:metal-dependent hydrolase [bacterium]|nr:metal-dependent hydrolase [bacterium]